MTAYKELVEQFEKSPESKNLTEKEKAFKCLELIREENKKRFPRDFDIEKARDEALKEKYGDIIDRH